MGEGGELCTPCGRCRQFMREFASPDTPIYLSDRVKVCKVVTLDEILPMSFGPDHLNKKSED